MTQPAALGMTQPRTKNPATNHARPRLPHLRPHPRRHPPGLPPRSHGRATPIVSHPCASATEQCPTAPRPRAISRNQHEAWSKEGRIWNHGILGGRSGEG